MAETPREEQPPLDYQSTVRDLVRNPAAGVPILVVLLGGLLACGLTVYLGARTRQPAAVAGGILAFIVVVWLLNGLLIVQPNEAAVFVLFGRYVGTVRRAGMFWVNPFFRRATVSLRIRNFESARLKVNDHDGNPIEIAAIVVWKVVDAAEAMFEVNDYKDYVSVQSESAVRALAALHPYDAHQDGQMSLRGNTAEVAEQLKREIQDRLTTAGVEVLEARISHLAYAPEIAAAMLRRQQASAVIAARQKIVEGAVSMVEMALHQLAERGIVQMDEPRKAAMVSNLMVVLCSEHNAQPVLNTGVGAS
jgi:regulator of protease activity HflC (stomatin/prohibitin superfamily)